MSERFPLREEFRRFRKKLRHSSIDTILLLRVLRSFLCTALIILFLPATGRPQLKFYENGQPTRTGADAALFPDTPTRSKIDLAGAWQYSLDGKDWHGVAVPSAYDFKGKVTFNRTFDVTAEMLDKYTFTLVCYGINHQSEIAINDNFIGRHLGGYSSFSIPIPPNTIQMGSQNAIKIVVDNELTPTTTIPLRLQASGWRTYGGIFRDIYILCTPKLYIEDVDVRSDATAESKTAKIVVRAQVTDRLSSITPEDGKQLGLQIEVYEKLTGTFVARSGIAPISPQQQKSISVIGEVTIAAPQFWSPSPDTSSLYVVHCQIVSVVNKEVAVLDDYILDFGLKDARWKDGQLYVNGRLTPLKGLLWHEDHATFASAMNYDALERDIASLKSLGANLIRFLYPPHPYMLNLCDRYGLMVMEGIPLVGAPAEILAKDYYQDLAATYVREMVGRDKNHVSIIGWGVGDDFETESAMACEYVNAMRNILNAIDKRPVYYTTRFVDDRCFENSDIIALNLDARSDPKEVREVLKKMKSRFASKPIIVARYGREVEPGNRNGYSDPLSMEAQARSALLTYDAIRDAKVAGSVLWAYNDWRTDRPSLSTHSRDPFLHTTGIVTYEREKRISFDVVRAMFNGEKAQALPVGTYSSSAPIIYVIAGLMTLITFAFVYNGNRRFRDAVNRSMFRTYNFFADVRDQRMLTYAHSIFLAVIVSVTWATLLSSFLTFYRDSILLDNFLTQMMSDGMKEWFVRLVWNPAEFILVVSLLLFLKLVCLSLAVRLMSMIVRTHVYFYHAFAVTMWSLLPYVLLIPLVMILYRLLEAELYLVPIGIAIGALSLWVLFRLLKGISIIYDVFSLKVYAVGLLIIVVAGAAIFGYVDYTRSTSVYLKYMMHSTKNVL